jgi:endogenous inhibitor of DNA gyrase (YacG/DUF329 family)
MSKHFQTRICPLCSKKLKIGDEDSYYTFFCEEFYFRKYDYSNWSIDNYDIHSGKVKESHYAITITNGIWRQSTIIPPYWIITYSDNNKTKIYKFNKDIHLPSESDLLMEVPIVVPSDYTPEQFAKKIKNLVIFT